MKNSLLTLLTLLLVITASAQNENATATVNTLPKNEVKVNALFLIAGAFNVTYKRKTGRIFVVLRFQNLQYCCLLLCVYKRHQIVRFH